MKMNKNRDTMIQSTIIRRQYLGSSSSSLELPSCLFVSFSSFARCAALRSGRTGDRY